MFPTGATAALSAQTNVSPRDPNAQNVQAGYTSLMAEQVPTGDTYYEVIRQNEEVGYSPTTQQVNDVLYQEESQRMSDMLPDILLDPTLTDEQKREALDLTTSRPENTLSYQYALEQIEEPEDIQSREYQSSKEAAKASILSVSEYNAALDAAQDQTDMSDNPSFVDNAVDFGLLMVPFWEQSTVAELQSKLGGDAVDVAEAFVLMGSSKQALRDAFTAMPIEQRGQAAQAFVDAIVEANSNSFMTNELNARGVIDMVINGDYENWERWLDNVVSLADLSIVGKPIKWGADYIRALNKARKVTSTVRSTSPHRMAQETNATAARGQVNDMISDDTGEVAAALTGTSRENAVLDSVLPDAGVGADAAGAAPIRNKVGNSTATFEKTLITNPHIDEAVEDAAIGALTRKEVRAANARVVNRLQSAKGVTSRTEMFSVKSTETGASIRGVYGPAEGTYANAQEARDLAAIALRAEGVDPASIRILKKDVDGEFKAVEGIPTERGEYLTSFDYDYEVNFSDIIGNWTEFDVKRNFLDRAPLASKGSVNRHLIDPASTLDPHIVFGANAAVDKAARVTKLMLADAKTFSDKLGSLPKDRQQTLTAYIKEANEKGWDFNRELARAEWNMTDSELDAIQSFRNYWDDVWAIRNRTDAKAMADDGYRVMEDPSTDTRFFGKPRQSSQVDLNKGVYNPETGLVERVTREQLNALEEVGGGVIQLRRPMDYDGVITDYVLSSKADMTRNVTKGDVVYPYRKGYYEVNYTQPHFIVKTVEDAAGNTYTKAVATAETFEDAELYLKRLAETDPTGKYSRRGDVKDRADLAGFEQDMYESYGHGKQRTRGKRLEDATAVVRNTEQDNIKTPVDAMIDTTRLIGNRVAMTPYMNATKQRFMETYADLLPKKNGVTQFPARMEDIGNAGSANSKAAADARTTFEYISYLEHGYINSMSEVSKSALRTAADALGARGFGKLESLARSGAKASISDTAKNAAFQLYIALNPLRQGLLNAHQSALLLANFPTYALDVRGLPAEFTAFSDLALSGGKNLKTLAKATRRSEDELRFMYREFQKSGLEDSIDVHNMVRGTLVDFTEGTKLSQNPVARGVGGAVGGVREVGFDAGEWTNLASSWLAHYNRASQSGKALNKTDLHKVGAEARNYTFNMNRAGDMPYNQNSASLLMQFFQVPHKAALQLTNRGLSPMERTRLGLYNAFAYSLPAGAMYSLFGDILPDYEEHPELHTAIVQGLEFYMWNKAIEGMTGLDSDIDFSSLAPSDPYGVYEVIHGIFTTEAGSLISASPAGSLFFGNNPRITNFAKTAARFFNVVDDFEGDPTTMSHVWNDFAQLSSGSSNYLKAKMAVEYGKLYSMRGEVVDPSVSTPEAIALAFGFPTMDAAREYNLNNKLYKTKESARKDVDKWFNEYTSRLSREGITAEETDYIVRTMSQAMRAFKDSPAALDRINYKLERAIHRGDVAIYNAVLKLAGELPPEEAGKLMRSVPNYNPKAKQQLIQTIDNINSFNSDGED
ncbi:putative Phage protein [Vibrio phage 409E50-1]|nr:putative Phage protein [Vibrio phage 521E56-1]CAH9011797.1 putative Phage protein [Vibrio phage 384E50-1]CAH9011826.1 putative Phage protein [Vibrio phage 409E50-1]CAH9011832.1 putative Phage protein [Vibrio phage 402E50-1]CAH9013197.1 putative Phage protein [Vibrio phage 405E50-1]